MTTKCEHQPYATKELAERALAIDIDRHKQSGRGGKSWKRLNVYQCRVCGWWHLGRANDMHFKPAKPKRVPSAGELMRKYRHLTERYDRRLLHRAHLLADSAQRNAAWLAAEAERERIAAERLADLADTIEIAKRLYQRP